MTTVIMKGYLGDKTEVRAHCTDLNEFIMADAESDIFVFHYAAGSHEETQRVVKKGDVTWYGSHTNYSEPMGDLPKVMVTLTLSDADASLEGVRARYGLVREDLDEEFGIIEVDPEKKAYTVRVSPSVASRLESEHGIEGFGDVKIATFGPPTE